jgi:rubrerythrin
MTKEQDKSIAALEQAIQMEIDGKEYYLKASERANNELGKKLLQSLAAEEDIHRKVFEDIFEDIRNKRGWPRKELHVDGGRALRTVFANAIDNMDHDVKSIPEELDAVQTAMAMENKTYDFYRERGKKATYDAEKQFYEALAEQEEQHHRVLLDYYEFLKNPKDWFTQKEHHSLDGG